MNVEDRLALIREVGEEIVVEDELRALLEAKPHPVCYDGFEPSGRIHIAQGVLRAINVNKMTRAGCTFKMFVADWHAWANNKMGGDLEKIQTVGKYFVEVWRAAGMDLEHVKFVWASEFVDDPEYWKKVMNIARDSSLDRILRTTQIMGRSDKDKLSASQILYPCMQAADIFHLGADITQLGMDQRKVNMLAREVAPKYGYAKPVVVSHHMLMGLQAPPAGDATALFRDALAKADLSLGTLHDQITTNSLRSGLDDLFFLFQSKRQAVDAKEAFNLAHAAVKNFNVDLRRIKREHLGLLGRQHSAGDVFVDPVLDQIEQAEKWANEIAALAENLRTQIEMLTIERATAMKMSKSNPDSAIFMTDTPADVERKMKNAYCPAKQSEENPVLEYFRYVIFQRHWANARTGRAGESPIVIERPEKFGGNATYETYAALEADFKEGKVHPMDLKKAAARYVNELLQPVREHFEKNEEAKGLKTLVDSWQVTR